MCDVRISNIEDICSFNPEFKRQVLVPDNERTKYIDMVNDLSKHIFKNKKHFMKVLYKIRKIYKILPRMAQLFYIYIENYDEKIISKKIYP